MMVVILNILISYSFAIHTSRLVRANNGGSKHFHRLCVCMFKLGWRKSRARKYRSQILLPKSMCIGQTQYDGKYFTQRVFGCMLPNVGLVGVWGAQELMDHLVTPLVLAHYYLQPPNMFYFCKLRNIDEVILPSFRSALYLISIILSIF